jgi:hypothetical protein
VELWCFRGGHRKGLFFKASVSDGFVEGVLENTEERRDGGHAETVIEQGLDAKEKLWGEFGALARRSRSEESGGAFVAEFFARAPDCYDRNTEGGGYLSLRGIAVGDELACKETKRGEVVFGVGEDGEMTVEIEDGVVAEFERELLGNERGAGGENGELDLRHS